MDIEEMVARALCRCCCIKCAFEDCPSWKRYLSSGEAQAAIDAVRKHDMEIEKIAREALS